MNDPVLIQPLTSGNFAPYGDIIDCSGTPDKMINAGKCARHHDLARLDFDPVGQPGISVFHAQPYTLPHSITLFERHPLGSQAFLPLSGTPCLVIVAGDDKGVPVNPQAFLTRAEQGINIHRNVWHGVLTPLNESARVAVVDWIGEQPNVEEYVFAQPFIVQG